MGQGITLDISARITGYQDSLNQLKSAIDKLDPGSRLARNLIDGLRIAQRQVQELSKNMTPRITSDNQLDKLTDKVNNTGEAIQRLALKLQSISTQDIKPEEFGEGLRVIQELIASLVSQINDEANSAMQDFILNSKELSDVFGKLGIDIKGKDIGEIFTALSAKAKEAESDVKKTDKALKSAIDRYNDRQTRLKSLQESPLNNKEEIQNNLSAITDSYTKAFDEMKSRIVTGMSQFGVDQKTADAAAATFLGGLTPENLQDKLEELRKVVEEELKKQKKTVGARKGEGDVSYSEIYSGLFDDKNQQKSRWSWANVSSKIFGSSNSIGDLRRQLLELYNQFSSEVGEGQRRATIDLISKGQIQDAVTQALKDLETAYKTVQKRMIALNNELREAAGVRDAAQQSYDEAAGRSKQIDDTITSLREENERLENENTVLKQQLDQAKEDKKQKEQDVVNKVNQPGKEVPDAIENLKISADEANKYSQALEKVQQREQMIGKIEGIVQRWFSIYAAVRMVGNAIKSIISTIKELDKTITDITIVTNMSREDLWGQMPTYTKMAQDYAVSISGVYQVSQLFYQQGLQTNDVLTLTGETLKMARIAGLDYAEATNYMTNALRSFKLDMDEASRVTDVYSVLAASAAVSVSEIAEAMSKTASSAYAVGASLENTATMITVMTEATRESATNIGSALKSIISRYGEMTSDPAKLVDSEGEAMSLNKVDRALQSVGISLQDAQGQFRNFDDVIAELASVWTTLDNNTQRYIATVMAGNRQQSRFLALVSSYDRYAELSEKAANAAGAGEEQFEKTLEGIEARTQQLQTSLQNLYTSAGLQDLYGSLLGIASNVLEYYNSISAVFGSGMQGAIAAVITFGAQFYNVAKIVMTVVKLIKAHYTASEKELTLITKAEEEIRTNGKISAETKAELETTKIWKRAHKEITADAIKEAETRAQAEINAENKAIKHAKAKKVGGQITYGVGTAASLVGTMVGGQWGNGISLAGGIASTAGAFMSGDWLGGIMSSVSAFTTFFSFISGAIETTKEKIERLTKEADELNKAAQSARKDEQVLKTNLDTLEKLTQKRYESEEAAEEYQTAVDKLAESYPELIVGFDTMNNVTLRTIDTEQLLIDARKNSAKATYEAALKEAEAHDAQVEAAEKQRGWFKDYSFTPYAYGKHFFSTYLTGAGTDKTFSQEFEKILDAVGYTPEKKSSFLQDMNHFYSMEGWSDENVDALYRIIYSFKNIQSFLREIDPEKKGLSIDIYDAIDNLLDTPGVKQAIEFDKNYKEQSSKSLNYYRKTASAYLNYQEDNERYSFLQESTNLSAIVADSIAKSYLNSEKTWTEYIEDAEFTGILSTIQNFYSNLSEEQQSLLNTMLSDTTHYTFEDIAFEFSNEEGFEDISDSIYAYYLTGITNTKDRILKNIEQKSKRNIEDTGTVDTELTNLLTDLGNSQEEFSVAEERYWKEVVGVYTELSDQGFSTEAFLLNAEDAQEHFKLFGPSIERSFLDLVEKYGLKTKSGIQNIIDELINTYHIDPNDEGLAALRNLQDTIIENIASSIIVAIDDFSEAWKDDSKEIASLVSGIDFSKVSNIIHNAENLGIILSYDDFIQSGDKFILDINKYNEYIQAYFNKQKNATAGWDKVINNAKKYTKDGEIVAGIDYKAIIEDVEYLKNIGFVLKDEYLENEQLTEEGQELLEKAILNSAKNLETYNWLIQQANNQLVNDLVNNGQIEAALKLLDDTLSDTEVESLVVQFSQGDFSNAPDIIAAELIKYYNSINDAVYKAFLDSISNQEITTITITKDNQALLNKFRGNGVSGGENIGETAIINFAEASVETLDYLYTIIAEDTAISPKERDSYLKTLDDELKSRNRENIFKEVFNSYESFDRELALKFASAVGEDLDAMSFTFDEVTRTYSMTIQQMREYAGKLKAAGADENTIAELTDIVQEAYDSVGNLIVKGLEGTLNNVESLKLAKFFGLNESDFIHLNTGIGITVDTAIKLYTTLEDVNSIAGQITFEKLKDSLTAAGGRCENIHKTLALIHDLNKQIQADTKNENSELRKQLKLYNEIAYSQMFDSSSYDFMGRSLPAGLEGPMKFYSNLSTMSQTMTDAITNKYIDPTAYYNIISEFHYLAQQTGQTFTIFGQTIDKGYGSVLKAWEAGTNAMDNVGGELKFSLEDFGIDFSQGIDGATTGIEDGIHEFAKSQVDLLTSLINFFDAMAAIESFKESNKALIGDDGIFNAKDIFGDNNQLTGQAETWIAQLLGLSDEYKAALNEFFQVQYKGKTIGIVDMFKDLPETANEMEEFTRNWQLFINALGADWNPNSPVESIKKFLAMEPVPEQTLELSLKMSEDGGTIEDANAFAALVAKFLQLDDSGEGNITIKGESENAAFTLDIENKGATAKLTWADNQVDEYNSLTDEDLYSWIQKKAEDYAKRNHLINLAPITLTAQKTVSVSNQGNESSVNISINYTNGTTEGSVTVGTCGRKFGPNEDFKTAGEALEAAAKQYNAIAGSGTLHNINLGGKTIKIISANNVEYDFDIAPGEPNTDFDWAGVVNNINAFVEAMDTPDLTGSKVNINTKEEPWKAELTTTSISGTKTIKYDFKLNSQTLTNKLDLQEQWAVIASNIESLRTIADTLPADIEGITASDSGNGQYNCSFTGINIDGTNTINYKFVLEPKDLTEKTAWDSAQNDVRAAITLYGNELGTLAQELGVKQFSLTSTGPQKGKLGVLISVDGKSVINTEYEIEWTDNKTAEEASAEIDAYRKELSALKANAESLRNEFDNSDEESDNFSNDIIDLFPDPIQYNASQTIQITDEGYKVYDSNGNLIGSGVYTTPEEAIQAALNAGKITNTIAQKTGSDSQRYRNEEAKAKAAAERAAVEKAERMAAEARRQQAIDSANQFNIGIENNILALEAAGELQARADAVAEALTNLLTLSNQQDIDGLIAYYNTFYKSGTTSLMGFKNQDLPFFGKALFDYVESTGQELESVTEDLSYELSDLGNWGVEGYLKAFEEAKTKTPAMQFIVHILQSIQEAQNSGSPAEEFVPYGEAAAEGYALGLKTYDFTNDATTMVDNFEAALKIALENKPLLASLLNSSINFKTSSNLPNQKDTEQQDLFTGNATEDIVDNTETTNSILTDNAASLDSLVRVTNAMFSNLPPEQNPAVWRLAFEGLGVHGDFWGEGNQLVLPNGEGGNAHFNLQDYVRQINELFASGELENFQVSIPLVLSNTGAFYTEINNAIAKVQNKTINVKVIPDTSAVTNMTFTVNVQGGGGQASQAKGNAQARGALMGELGPELYVTGGHYYVAGQNGAEFVDLPDDAIVFNHLQTKRLMSTGSAGRGKAVTNEKNATSYATGNVAMASAADTANALRNILAMWKALADRPLKDLATKGGGGGGGGGNKSNAAFIGDLERWYNLLRQIEKAEKQINYEEQLRSKIQSDRIINGKALYASQKRQLEALDEEIQHHQELAALQRSYYKERIDDLRTTQFPNIFDYDEEKGLLQFVNGTMINGDKGGLAALADLMATDIHGKPKYTAKEQYEKLLAWGFGEEMKYNDSGELIDVSKDEGYATAVEAFWNRNQSWIEELDELSDSIIEQEEKILDAEEKSNKILQEIVDNQREVEDKILEAIEAREQAVIDKLQDTYDALSDAAEKYVDGLNDALTKEREMYQRQQNDSDLVKLQRRLAILQRSGGSGAEILSLQKQIDSQLQDRYFEQQQSQIDAIKEASDNELEKLQQQIDIATETLEYAKENGLLWREVYDVMARNPEDIVSFITEHSKDWSSKSTLAQSEELRTLTSMIEQWSEYYRDTSATELMGEQGNRSYENWRKANMDKYYDKVWEENKLEAKEIYARKYAETGDSNKAAVEAEMFLNKKMSEYKAAHPEEFPKEEEKEAPKEEEKKTGGGKTVKDIQDLWNQKLDEFNAAKKVYNQKKLSFKDWYAKNNKWGYSWAEISRGAQGSGYSDWNVAYNEAQAAYDKYATAFDNTTKDQRQGAKKTMDLILAEMRKLLNGYPEALSGYSLPTYDRGGMVNETGLALVHAKEGVITPDQVDLLRDLATIQQQLYNSHMLDSIRDNWRHVLNSIDDSANNSITIENATVEMNVQSIANDYDARRAAQMALDEMLAIARKTSVQSIRR